METKRYFLSFRKRDTLKNNKILLIILIFSSLLFSNKISQKGIATASSKNKACQQALFHAQTEALHQSGINIFTSSEKKQTMMNNESIKNVINTSLQKSYGYISTISKKESTQYNSSTGYITCKVNGVFEVDTSKLKSQLLALSKKYDNQYETQNNKSKALKGKNELMQKYFILKNNITKIHTFHYSDSYDCGEHLSFNKCKIQLKTKIKTFTKKKLADKYDIDSSLIKMDNIKLKNNIKSTIKNGLSVQYNGKVDVKASSIQNPYIDEINSFNAYLGEKQIFTKNEYEEPESFELGEKISESMGSLADFFTSRKYKIFYTEIGGGDFLVDWFKEDCTHGEVCNTNISGNYLTEIYMQITPISDYFIKLGKGKGKYKSTPIYDGVIYPLEKGTETEYSFAYDMIGLSMSFDYDAIELSTSSDSTISLDLDYIIPSVTEGTKTNYSFNGDDRTLLDEVTTSDNIKPFLTINITQEIPLKDFIVVGIGLHYSSHESMGNQWITLKAGAVF